MSFCARRLTRHPNQSQALYGVSGKAQPLARARARARARDRTRTRTRTRSVAWSSACVSDCDCDSAALQQPRWQLVIIISALPTSQII